MTEHFLGGKIPDDETYDVVVDFGGGRAGIISGSDGQRSCACVTFDECHFRRYFRESKMGNQSNGPLARKNLFSLNSI